MKEEGSGGEMTETGKYRKELLRKEAEECETKEGSVEGYRLENKVKK